ncbi:MAG: hypothetical protein ACR652_24645 [Methylocystis sp.]|uniref:hypothetical protein n=1 Tax=Methylocystis sp. TaxID=1911079 RepID=UPI003DA69F75
MNVLSDFQRESLLWTVASPLVSLRDAAQKTGHSKTTALSFIRAAHSLTVTSGYQLREPYRDFDQYRTVRCLPLNDRFRAAMYAATPLPLLYMRGVMAQAQDDSMMQDLLDAVLPLIALVYPKRRSVIVELEAREEGGLGPTSCRHCAGMYGWKRHENICVRFGLT